MDGIFKIGTLLLSILAVTLIAVLGEFFYEFLLSCKHELNTVLLYGMIFSTILVGLVLSAISVFVCGMLYLRYKEKMLANQEYEQAIRITQVNSDLHGATAKQIHDGRVFMVEQQTDQGVVKFKEFGKPPALPKPKPIKLEKEKEKENPIELFNTMLEPGLRNDLLEELKKYPRILLVGGQNAGKTTLLKHIARMRTNYTKSEVVLLDSHNTPNKWDSKYRVVGHGRDYPAIERELKNTLELMNKRYKEMGAGHVNEGEHKNVVLLSDEWTTVSKNIDNLDTFLLPLLTEGRKSSIDIIIACHSKTAGSMGLKGQYDLLSNFSAILTLKNIDGIRKIELDNGETKEWFLHPGEYR